jgi:hypothetical protein
MRYRRQCWYGASHRAAVVRVCTAAALALGAALTSVSAGASPAQPVHIATPGLPVAVSGVTVSADGRYIAYASDEGTRGSASQVRLFDVDKRSTQVISVDPGGRPGNADSGNVALSSDGRFVAFASAASNLVAGDGNASDDIFLRDRLRGVTTIVSRTATGGSPRRPLSVLLETARVAVSDNGRYVAFLSDMDMGFADSNAGFTYAYRYDTHLSVTEMMSRGPAGEPVGVEKVFGHVGQPMSGDGRLYVFSTPQSLTAADTDAVSDVYLRDVRSGRVKLLSAGLEEAGTPWDFGSPTIDRSGRLVAFTGCARLDDADGCMAWGASSDLTGRRIYASPLPRDAAAPVSSGALALGPAEGFLETTTAVAADASTVYFFGNGVQEGRTAWSIWKQNLRTALVEQVTPALDCAGSEVLTEPVKEPLVCAGGVSLNFDAAADSRLLAFTSGRAHTSADTDAGLSLYATAG